MPADPRRDRLERLTNLVLVLLDANRPLTLREITDRVEGYPDTKESTRQAFERDKKALRDLGIPVTNVAIGGDEQVGYVLQQDDYYLPELELDEAEAQALAFAVAAVHLEGNAGRDALSTLGHASGAGPAAPVAVLPALPALSVIHDALRQSALLSFRYRAKAREVEPYGLTFKNAAWYLVGRDRGAEAMRTFRVDRFESDAALGEPGAFDPPADLDLGAEVHLLPFSSEAGEGLPEAQLTIDARLARQVAGIVPRDAVTEWRGDGSVELRLPVGDEHAFASFVAGLGDTAVVLGPPTLREAVMAHLQSMATIPEHPADQTSVATDPLSADDPDGSTPEALVQVSVPNPSNASHTGPRRAPGPGPVAGERLRRLLAVLVYLARVGEAPIIELADRFDMAPDELVHDLELAACCGVPPYTPDQLIELIVDGDHVSAYGLGHLAKPRRLTPEEGFALAAAGAALCEVEGAGEESALRSALAKLATALGDSRLSVEVGRPEHLVALQDAASRHERVEIDYVSSATATPSTRQVDAYQVVLREGRFYLDGWCHLANDLRRFQVERVQAVRLTGEHFDPPSEMDEALAGPEAFLGGPEAIRVRIAFPAGSELGVEQVAASPIEKLPDGRLAVDVLVADAEGFLARLLLRLGPGTEVLAPSELGDVLARAATSALGRYAA